MDKMSGGLHRSSSATSKNVLPSPELLDDLCRCFMTPVFVSDLLFCFLFFILISLFSFGCKVGGLFIYLFLILLLRILT